MKLLSGYDLQLQRLALKLDFPPLSANSMDDEFDDGTLDAKWTWLNQGTLTATEQSNVLTITNPGSVADARGLYQSVPSSPWCFRTKFYAPSGPIGTNTMSGLFVGEATPGNIRTVGQFESEMRGISYVTPSTAAAAWGLNFGTEAEHRGAAVFYAQMAFDGTYLTAWLSSSNDGQFLYVNEEAVSFTPGIVGLLIASDGTTEMQTSFDWFRRIF